MPLQLTRPAALGSLLLLATCGGGTTATRSRPAAPVDVTISVDWEGAFLDQDAMDAVARFRADNPDVPLTHFICAAYYTKPGAVAGEVSALLRANVRDGDEAGLHFHAWHTLVAASGVTVREARSFLSPDGVPMEFDDDVGFDVDPSIYTVDELRAIVRTSRAFLTGGGLTLAPIFRAGGWIGAPNVLEAVRAEGMTIDSSAIDPAWLGEGAGSGKDFALLAARVRAVWPHVDRTTQPFVIDTPAGRVLEMPDSGAMADHMAVEEMVEHVEAAARSTRRPIFVHLGFHAETADLFAPLLTRALSRLRALQVPMTFVTLTRAAAATGLAPR